MRAVSTNVISSVCVQRFITAVKQDIIDSLHKVIMTVPLHSVKSVKPYKILYVELRVPRRSLTTQNTMSLY